jgi:hypothetical protein
MKQYLMSVYHPEDPAHRSYIGAGVAQADMDAIGADVNALNDEIRKAGAWVFAGGLHPSGTATTLRVKNGEVLTTDGPFAEAKEQVGGFWVIKVANLDEALKWGAKATQACRVPIEVRPFQDETED